MPKVIYKNLSPVDMEIKRLVLDDGLLDCEIGEQVGLTSQQVNKRRRAMGLRDNYRNGSMRKFDKNAGQITGELVAKLSKSETDWKTQCQEILGTRLQVKTIRGETVYVLDGKMTTSCKVIELANRIAPMLGKPHIGKKPNEIYKPRLVQSDFERRV